LIKEVVAMATTSTTPSDRTNVASPARPAGEETATTSTVDTELLEAKVKNMYREVAEHPRGSFHFELGERVAASVGYEKARLAGVPGEAVESFAGVGYFFDLADLQPGERVVDLGSGSGMDVFYAAGLVGPTGRVIGVDFTVEQLDKARDLAVRHDLRGVEFREGRIEDLPVADESVDCVISNGVINLCPDKAAVFAEAARVLRPGGRLAVADIVTERPLTEAIVCNADLWASCIGGAAQQDVYLQAIEAAGFVVTEQRPNTYAFISDSARNASATYGVKSISVLATRR
jgi:ubiquinone/menaquinone biosynthesis C-methylase UbiE